MASGKLAASVACLILFLSGIAPAAAALLHLRAYLNGAQVPTVSAQTGVATVTFDTVTKQLNWSVTYTGLTGSLTVSHFHGPAAAGTDAAPVVTMPNSASPLTGSATLDSTQEAQLLSGQWYINIHSSTFPGGEIRGQVRRVIGDLDGNGRADLLWRHETAGTVLAWLMNGTAIAGTGSPATVADAGWQVVGRGDFDGDGKLDILWRHTNGTVFVWLMNGTAIAGTGSPATVTDTGWQVQGVGDFDGDGKADVLWRHSNGTVLVWRMNGTAIAGTGSPATVSDTGWQIQGVGDFNGDGRADVLWRHANGSVLVWLMNTNGTSILSTGSPATVTDANWLVQGVADFNGDGKADILWKYTTNGLTFVWLMNGTAIAGTGSPASVGAENGWQVMSVADFDGDGRADIFWRHLGTGTTLTWLMNGTAIGSSASPASVSDLLWTTQGRGANRWASLVGAQNAANLIAQAITSNGANLTFGHLTPLFASGYQADGFDATEDAGILAGDMRGNTISSITVDRLLRFDAANQAAFVTASLAGTAPGPTPIADTVTEQNGGLGFRRQPDGTWKMYGNQRPGEISAHVEMRTDSFPGGVTGPRQHINVDVRTRQNAYTAVTVDGGGFSNSSITKSLGVDVVTAQAEPSPATPLTYLRDQWFTGADSALSTATTFTFTLTPAAGPVQTHRVLSNAITTQFVTVTSPTLHTLAAANLGGNLTVNWTLPAFTISRVKLSGHVRTAVSPSPGFQCTVDDIELGTAATTGQISLPNSCNSQGILEAGINVAVEGVNGERTIYIYNFQ